MIPKDCKRLAEVDFPIAEVSIHAGSDKYLRYKPTTTLHTWWAQRPLAACRAVLLALLLPDPCDGDCPEEFKKTARGLLQSVQGKAGSKDAELQRALLKFLASFADPDLSQNRTYVNVARALIKAAHAGDSPLVVDTFAGAGSIPLEAARLNCDTFASDLNPVATLILKAILEDIPRAGPGLAEEVRRAGDQIKTIVDAELGDFYPADQDGSRPIVYLWARTVRCESPRCGAEIPLVSSFWLCKNAKRRHALRYKVRQQANRPPQVDFEVFEPTRDSDVPNRNIARAKATCLCCKIVLSPDRVRLQLREQHGGADPIFSASGQRVGGAQLVAVVTRRRGDDRRHYRPSTQHDYKAVQRAQSYLANLSASKPKMVPV